MTDLEREFCDALIGEEDGSNGRLGWLAALISDMKQSVDNDASDGDVTVFRLDDPPATWEAIAEVDALIKASFAALAKARGEQP